MILIRHQLHVVLARNQPFDFRNQLISDVDQVLGRLSKRTRLLQPP